jgi:hypothetical protein
MCGGRRSDEGRGSTSGGSKTVRVRGYTRANGTYVAGHTRSMPVSGPKSKSTTTPQKLIDTDGSTTPPVQAIPRSSRAAANLPDASQGKTVHVRGYTRSNGTHVAGYMRSLPSLKGNSGRGSAATSNGSSGLVFYSRKSYQPTNPSRTSGNVVHERGYTRSDSTHMHVARSSPTNLKYGGKRLAAAVLPVPVSLFRTAVQGS